jgi:hypothetical protein
VQIILLLILQNKVSNVPIQNMEDKQTPFASSAARNWNRSSHDGAMHLLKVDMDGAFYLDWSERTAAITKQLSPLQEMVPYHAT